MGGHIADLRNEARKRKDEMRIVESLNYFGYYTFEFTQNKEALARAQNGEERATEVSIGPYGELLQLKITIN